jgi:hypothetical protein
MLFLRLYQDVISWIEHHSPGPDKFDHSYFGMAIWVIASVLLRSNLRSSGPILVLAALELGNEVIDRLTVGRWVWPDLAGDVAATFFWPLTLLLLLRSRTIRA